MHTLVIFALLALADPAASAPSCPGADPAITSAVVRNVMSDAGLNHYQFAVTVVNNGSIAQASNTLQFVDVFQGNEKLDAKSVPPLRAGEAYTVSYVSDRSRQAGDGTSELTFKLDLRQSASQTCNLANDTASVSF